LNLSTAHLKLDIARIVKIAVVLYLDFQTMMSIFATKDVDEKTRAALVRLVMILEMESMFPTELEANSVMLSVRESLANLKTQRGILKL